MRRTERLGALVALAGISLLPGRIFAEPAKAEEPPELQEGMLREAKGRVKDLDKGRNQLTVQGPQGKALTLQIDKTTTVFVDGRVSNLEEVEAGAEVRASFELKQGANRAQWVEINKKSTVPPEKQQKLPDAPTASEQAPAATPHAPH